MAGGGAPSALPDSVVGASGVSTSIDPTSPIEWPSLAAEKVTPARLVPGWLAGPSKQASAARRSQTRFQLAHETLVCCEVIVWCVWVRVGILRVGWLDHILVNWDLGRPMERNGRTM